MRFADGQLIQLPTPIAMLIGLLATRTNHRISRAIAAQTIWYDQDEDHARHCLATSLWRFKSLLGKRLNPLVSDGEMLSLDGHAWLDVTAFETRLKRESRSIPINRLRRAIYWYHGDFLSGCDNDWALIERERFACIYIDALVELAELELRSNNLIAAASHARRACQLEPLREDAHRLLMRVHVASGNRGLAIKQFQHCISILDRELSVEPMDETKELARALGQTICENTPAPKPMDHQDPSTPGSDFKYALVEGRNALASALAAIDRSLTFL